MWWGGLGCPSNYKESPSPLVLGFGIGDRACQFSHLKSLSLMIFSPHLKQNSTWQTISTRYVTTIMGIILNGKFSKKGRQFLSNPPVNRGDKDPVEMEDDAEIRVAPDPHGEGQAHHADHGEVGGAVEEDHQVNQGKLLHLVK